MSLAVILRSGGGGTGSDVARDVYICTGQSRTFGGPNYTGPSLLTAGAYPGLVQYAALTTGALNNLVSGYYKSHSTEYPATQIGNRLHALDPDTLHMVQVHADGGATAAQLMKAGTSGIYEEILATYTAAHTTNPGRKFTCRGVCYFHGEADRDLPRAEYKALLLQWHADLQRDLRQIDGVDGSIPPIYGFVDQMTKRFLASAYPGSSLGQLDAYRENAHIFLVGPTYHLPMATDPGPPPSTFDLHHTNAGSVQLGKMYARAIESVRTTGRWEPTAPKKITRVGRKVTVQYHVPTPPLRINTVDIPAQAGFGFILYDASGAAGLAVPPYITGGDTVVLDANRDLVAPVAVTYAQDTTVVGNICDSDSSDAGPSWAVWSRDGVPFTAPARATQPTWSTVLPDPGPGPGPGPPPPSGSGRMPPMRTVGDSLSHGGAAGGPGGKPEGPTNPPSKWFPYVIQSYLSDYYDENVVMHGDGYGGERVEGTGFKQGGRPGILNAFTVPASGGVTILAQNDKPFGAPANPGMFSNGIDVNGNDLQQNAYSVTIGAGATAIQGKLTKVDNGKPRAVDWSYRFTRNNAGSAVNIAAGTLMRFDDAAVYRDHAYVIFCGHNNKKVDPGVGAPENMDLVPAMIQEMVDYITAPTGQVPRYVVCGMITADPIYYGTATQAEIDWLLAKVDSVNADLQRRFSKNYVDLRDYLASKQALVDVGVITASQSPSREDQKGIDGRYPCRSLQAVGNPHLGELGNKAIGERVGRHVVGQNWRRA